jgi:NAD(P)H-flavin reductase
MSNEIEVTIYTEDQSRVSLSEWDDGGAWLKIGVRNGGAYTTLTRDEAQQLLAGLQAILAKEVTV